jgi:hypothetical protein
VNLDTGTAFRRPLTAAVFDDKQFDPITFINDTDRLQLPCAQRKMNGNSDWGLNEL